MNPKRLDSIFKQNGTKIKVVLNILCACCIIPWICSANIVFILPCFALISIGSTLQQASDQYEAKKQKEQKTGG